MSKKKITPEAQAILSAADAGHLATTIALVQRFIKSEPESPRAWLDLGLALGQLCRYEEAEKALLEVIKLSDDVSAAPIYGEIGNLYRSQGEFDSAATWYQKQIAAQPNESMGHLYLGNLLFRQGSLESAKTAFENALACEQVCAEEAHYSLGLVNRSLGQLNESKSHFEKALELDDRFAAARTALKDVKSAISLTRDEST